MSSKCPSSLTTPPSAGDAYHSSIVLAVCFLKVETDWWVGVLIISVLLLLNFLLILKIYKKIKRINDQTVYCILSMLIEILFLMAALCLIFIQVGFLVHKVTQNLNQEKPDNLPVRFEIALDILDNLFTYCLDLVTIL